MKPGDRTLPVNDPDLLCPDLTANWQLNDQSRTTGQVILQAKVGNRRYQFDALEGYALRYFTGQFRTAQINQFCQARSRQFIPSDFVTRLWQKLIELEILPSLATTESTSSAKNIPTQNLGDRASKLPPSEGDNNPQKGKFGPTLKSTVEWIPHPDGYWILRNVEDMTCMQVDDYDRELILQLGNIPPTAIANEYDLTLEELQYLLRMLTTAGMLEGTKPPKPSNQFSLLQLFSLKIPLFNPDSWLAKHVDKLPWVWTWQFGFFLISFLSTSVAVWSAMPEEMFASSQQVWVQQGNTAILTFTLLATCVIFLHELGHAFTLKHYGGTVPTIGLLLVGLIPGCYTDTTDAYSLVRRKQRILVVAAGVIVQVAIWSIAVWIWVLSTSQPWLHSSSYLLTLASLLTVALNLNPLNKFDGYYLLSASSGINNLRERSFQFYAQLLKREPSLEESRNCWVLAAYAPCSIIYTLLVLAYLLNLLGNWMLQNIPAQAFDYFPHIW